MPGTTLTAMRRTTCSRSDNRNPTSASARARWRNCASGATVGTVRRFDVGSAPLPQGAFNFNISTHGLGLAEAVELARALDQLPDRCVVYAIEAASFQPGAPLSPPVAAAIAEVGNRVRDEI